jgi:hypothetical protein
MVFAGVFAGMIATVAWLSIAHVRGRRAHQRLVAENRMYRELLSVQEAEIQSLTRELAARPARPDTGASGAGAR